MKQPQSPQRSYAMLLLPSSNRVYNAAVDQLAQAELQCFNAAVLEHRLSKLHTQAIAGVGYLIFESPALDEQDIAYLSNLSFLFALYEQVWTVEHEQKAPEQKVLHLMPVPLKRLDRYDNDLLSIMKFAGKTNEQFTRMLLNTCIMASSRASDMISDITSDMTYHRLRVLDPVCGRGTTLNQALMYGYNAAGIEIDKSDFDAYSVFINRWLKDKLLKHKSESVQLRKHGKTQAYRLGVKLASCKQDYKRHNVQTLDVVNADTLQAREFFKPGSFDILVADLPYGVKHGNRSAQGLARSPMQLLEAAIPVWSQLLCEGGAIGLSWNTYLGKKQDIIDLLHSAGLSIYPPTRSDAFKHRVDRAIIRDIIIATRS